MVDIQRISKNILFQEMNESDRSNWFDCKTKKFLHNIDTFYYSIKLKNDFTVDSKDEKVIAFRRTVERLRLQKTKQSYSGKIMQLYLPDMGDYLNLTNLRFDKYYDLCLELPDMFDIFVATYVPGNEVELSVTSEIIVQIRSEMLWLYGVHDAFKKSYEWAKALCNLYGFTIREVKENRTDFCWHTNYLEQPKRFFSIENMDSMRCTRLGRKTHYTYEDKGSNDSEFSYYSRGKRGGKTFLRIYDKTMEVVQEGYKAFFLKTWLFHGLINRYDFFVYEQAYLKSSWDYVTIARLNFYVEYGKNESYKEKCRKYIEQFEANKKKCTNGMVALAEQLTPPLNTVINVEFQLMRKASKSYKILPIKDNTKAKEAKRIYDFLDNHRLIADYLTDSVFRLVEKTGDSNKSRRPNCGFWTALRRTKFVDAAAVPNGLKMQRIYKRQLSAEKMKKAIIHKAVTYGMYMKGINDDSPVSDAMNAILCLNDNDIKEAKRYKEIRAKQFNKELLAEIMPKKQWQHNYTLLDELTGELVNPEEWNGAPVYSSAGKLAWS